MKKYYIDKNYAVDLDTEVELASNGLTGDAKVTLYKALEVSPESLEIPVQNEQWMYYLQTNGNPVILHDSNGQEFIETLGLDIDQMRETVIDALDEGDNGEWPLAYLPK